jgi:superfamily II DNA or RNA helicase
VDEVGQSELVPRVDFEKRLQALTPRMFQDGLRPAQTHVLAQFAEHHTATSDVGIELPTGEGKTLIGLLLADWALDEGKSVAYLTGTRQLADQVMEQVALLPGLVAHRFAGGDYPGAALDDYHQAQAVGVMNYWVYFNSSPRVEAADLVIFDDAHLVS